MNYRNMGRTDLVVSELGFGGFAIGGCALGASYGPTDDAESTRAIHAALDLGCNFFDTADIYGGGHGESLIGAALRESARGKDAIVATKGGCRLDRPGQLDFSREYLFAAAEASARRLGRSHIDLYLLHNPPAEVIRQGEIFDTLERLIRAGVIRYGGVSVHTADEGVAAMRHPACSAIQIIYNLLSQLYPERAADGLLDAVAHAEVGLIAREPLANGFLARRHAIDEEYPPGDLRAGFSHAERRLRVQLADSLRPSWPGAPTPAQLALRYVLDEPAVSTVIAGMKTRAQVDDNVGATAIAPFAVHYEALAASRGGEGARA